MIEIQYLKVGGDFLGESQLETQVFLDFHERISFLPLELADNQTKPCFKIFYIGYYS